MKSGYTDSANVDSFDTRQPVQAESMIQVVIIDIAINVITITAEPRRRADFSRLLNN